MHPAEALDIAREVLGLMAGYPSVRMNREETARMSAAFVSALAALPVWAIRRACQHWAAGRVPDSNPAFPPNAVQIKLEADRIVAPRRHEVGRIGVILSAEVVETPSDEARQACTANWFENIRPVMQNVDVTEDVEQRERDRQLEANRRLRQREHAAHGITDGRPMTVDMRRKVGLRSEPHEGEKCDERPSHSRPSRSAER